MKEEDLGTKPARSSTSEASGEVTGVPGAQLFRAFPQKMSVSAMPRVSLPSVSVIVNGSPVPLKPPLVQEPTPVAVTSDTAPKSVPHVVRVSVVGIPPEPDERSSSGASSGSGSDDEATAYDSDSGAEMKFHLRELEDTTAEDDKDRKIAPSAGATEPILDAELAILSRQGTVRGVRNLVRASIKCIADCQEGKVREHGVPCLCCAADKFAKLCVRPVRDVDWSLFFFLSQWARRVGTSSSASRAFAGCLFVR